VKLSLTVGKHPTNFVDRSHSEAFRHPRWCWRVLKSIHLFVHRLQHYPYENAYTKKHMHTDKERIVSTLPWIHV